MNISLNETGLEHLNQLIHTTGAGHLIVLRFALLYSLKVPSIHPVSAMETRHKPAFNVSWDDFVRSGSDTEDYEASCRFLALLKQRSLDDAVILERHNTEPYCNAHLHRGLHLLSLSKQVEADGIVGLVDVVNQLLTPDLGDVMSWVSGDGGIATQVGYRAVYRNTLSVEIADVVVTSPPSNCFAFDITVGDRCLNAVRFFDSVTQRFPQKNALQTIK